MKRKLFSKNEIIKIAKDNKLSQVYFQKKICKKTFKEFEVGYVIIKNEQELFCKSQQSNILFYLCNEFEDLIK